MPLEVSVGNITNKFWGNTSILVPDLNKFNNLMGALQQLENVIPKDDFESFTIYWFEQNIVGEVKLPGEWNYAKIGEKYYHLIKTKSDGILRPGQREYFFYSVVYDDWANEFLKNQINVTGTINKTGDRVKVEENIIQTAPILTDLNDRLDFDSHTELDVNAWNIKEPSNDFYNKNSYYWIHPLALTWLNYQLQQNLNNKYTEPNYDRFESPVYIQERRLGNWKISIVEAFRNFMARGLAVFDLDKSKIHFSNFQSLYPGENVFVLAYDKMDVKQIAKTYNSTKWINQVDLSGLTDIEELDDNFAPLNNTKINSTTLITALLNKYETQKNEILKNYKDNVFNDTDFRDVIAKSVLSSFSELGNKLFISNGVYLPKFNGLLNNDIKRDIGIYEDITVEHRIPNEWSVNGRIESVRDMSWTNTIQPFDFLTGDIISRNWIFQRGLYIGQGEGFLVAIKEGVDLNNDRFLRLEPCLEGNFDDNLPTDKDKNYVNFAHLIRDYKNNRLNWWNPDTAKFELFKPIVQNDKTVNYQQQVHRYFPALITNYWSKHKPLLDNLKQDQIPLPINKNSRRGKLSREFPNWIYSPVFFAKYSEYLDNGASLKLKAVLFKAVHNIKSKGTIINDLKPGLVWLPDYQNHGFVPAILTLGKIIDESKDINIIRKEFVRFDFNHSPGKESIFFSDQSYTEYGKSKNLKPNFYSWKLGCNPNLPLSACKGDDKSRCKSAVIIPSGKTVGKFASLNLIKANDSGEIIYPHDYHASKDGLDINQEKPKLTNLFKRVGLTDEENNTRIDINEMWKNYTIWNYNIKTPDEEDILANIGWDKVPRAIKEGYAVRALMTRDDWNLVFTPWKVYCEERGNRDYCRKGEWKKIGQYKLPIKKGKWPIYITFPATANIDIQKILDEYSDLGPQCIQWYNLKTKKSKGRTKNIEDEKILIFDQGRTGGAKDRRHGFCAYWTIKDCIKGGHLPKQIQNDIIQIYLDPRGSSSYSQRDTERLIELSKRLYEAFFLADWNKIVNYKGRAVFGDIYHDSDQPSDTIPFTITYFRPYKNFWFCIQVNFQFVEQKDADFKNQKLRSLNTKYQDKYLKKTDWINADSWTTTLPIVTWSFNTSASYVLQYIKSDNSIRWNDNVPDDQRKFMKFMFLWNGYGWHDDKNRPESSWLTASYDGEGFGNGLEISNATNNDWYNTEKIIKSLKEINIHDMSYWLNAIKGETGIRTKINLNPKSISNSLYTRTIENSGIYPKYWNREMLFNIPNFIWKYLDPMSIGTIWKPLNVEQIKNQSVDEVKKFLDKHIRDTIDTLHTKLIDNPVWFDLKGTDFILCAKYNIRKEWDFEILIKNHHNVLKDSGGKKVVFNNNKTDEVDGKLEKIINSTNELNIYGHKIVLKDRFALKGENIDLGIHVESLTDKYQSSSTWYYVKVESPDSNILTQIEVPKEAAISSNMSPLDKRQLHQSFIYNNAERYFEKENYNLEKSKYFGELKMDEFYTRQKQTQGWTSVALKGLSSIGSWVYSTLMGKAFGGPVGAAAGAISGGISSGANIGLDIWSHTTGYREEVERLQFRREMGINMFALRDDALREKHAEAERLDRLMILNASTANTYPSNNNALIYRSLNQALGRSNIYLTQYRPKGKLLEMLKHYYDEYGFDILLTDQTINGIDSIKKHIRYITIKENNHENSTIRSMIESRLLAGIKIV